MKLHDFRKSPALGLTLAAGCLFWLQSANPLLAKADKAGKAAKRDEAAALFEPLRVLKMSIKMDPGAVAQLQKSYSNTVLYLPATVESGGKVYEQVGVHLRGVSTFQTADHKPGWTLKFNEWVPGANFHGLKKIRLSNCTVDRTYLQEMLAGELFRAAGVPAPRSTYARVEFNGRDLGLYLLLEGVTKEFLKENFGTDNGNLYEGEEADIDEHLEQDYGKRSKHQSDRQPLIQAVKEPDLEKRFKEIERLLDMKSFVSYLAMEILLDNWDGYTQRLTNYRIFCDHDSGKFHFIPHGLDRIFEAPQDPILPQMKGMVGRALLETPDGRKRYLARMRELHGTLLEKERLAARIKALNAIIQPVLAEVGENKAQFRALVVLEKRMKNRLSYVAKELEQEEARQKAGQ